jgi:DNA modification methylase
MTTTDTTEDARRVSRNLDAVVVRLGSGVTLFHGDCLTILPVDCDIIITDQPYGTGWLRGGGKVGEFKPRQEGAEWDVFNLAWMDAAPPRVATFCPAKGVWDVCRKLRTPHVLKYRKTNPAPFGYAEEPIVSSHAMLGKWEKEAYNGDNSLHPCQKPVDLLAWLVNGLTVEGETVCDPFMGSGSMGVACIRTGRRFVGIERDPAHFATARARLENELRQGLLPLTHNTMLVGTGKGI